MQGRIKFFNVAKQYGFITPDDGGADEYFHVSSLTDQNMAPFAGDVVSYDVGPSKDGKRAQAVNVRILSKNLAGADAREQDEGLARFLRN